MNKAYPFIEWRFRAYSITIALFVVFGIAILFHGGINYGIDFVGGTSVIVKFDRAVDAAMLGQIREFLNPVGLANNIRTIGGGTSSAEEAREISIDVRGSDWVDQMVDRLDAARKAGALTPDSLDKVFAQGLEPRAMHDLKAYFLPPPDDTNAPALYDLNGATRSDLNEIFQTIFNENISLSVQKVLTDGLPPEGGARSFDINNVGNADNLAAALAELKRKRVEEQIVGAIDTAAGRPWATLDEFLSKTGLGAFDGPDLRKTLSGDTATGAEALSVTTATPVQLSHAFLPAFEARFRTNAGIIVEYRDREFGGLFPAVDRAAERVPADDAEMRDLILKNAHAGRFIIASSETVGAAVGGDLKLAALYAIIVSLIGLILYIWYRFELRYGVGSIIATLHDTMLTLGLIGAFGIEFNIPIVAAILTVMGYSINDTIVVYDRIREKLGKLKGSPDPAIIDLAITQTLSRTTLTAGTTIVAILCFYIFGPAVTRDLCFALTFGILIGTFSSIFVAAPVLVEWERFAVAKK